MKSLKKITSIVLSVVILFMFSLSDFRISAQNRRTIDDIVLSAQKFLEQQRETKIFESSNRETKYTSLSKPDISEYNDLFVYPYARPNLKAIVRPEGETLMRRLREQIEDNAKAEKAISRSDDEYKQYVLKKISTLESDDKTFAVDSANKLINETSPKEAFSAYVLAELLKVSPHDLLTQKVLSEEKITLTEAEEDFLYFYPANITVLRQAITAQYGGTDDAHYTALFNDAMALSSSSDTSVNALIPEIKQPDAPKYTFVTPENENISTSTGELTYTENLINVKGVNGMDLVISAKYNSTDSRQSSVSPVYSPFWFDGVWNSDYYLLDNCAIYDNNIPYFLARGWKLDLPTCSYDHLYIPNVGSFVTEDFSLPEIGIETCEEIEVNGLFAEGQPVKSHFNYKLKNGTSYHFTYDGMIMRIQDKYGNKINFYYCIDTTGAKRISKIIDSACRKYTFSYEADQNTPTKSTITITKPDSSTVLIGTTSFSAYPREYRQLDYITHQATPEVFQTKTFTYNNSAYSVNLGSKDVSQPSYNSPDYFYLLLTKVTSPTIETNYTYEYYVHDAGWNGYIGSYRVTSRWDYSNSNKLIFQYEGTHTGFPNEEYCSPYSVSPYSVSPHSFEYAVHIYNDTTLIHSYLNKAEYVDYYEGMTYTNAYSQYKYKYTVTKQNFSPNRQYNTEKTVYIPGTPLVESTHNHYYRVPVYEVDFQTEQIFTYSGLEVTSYNNPRGNTTDELYKTRITYDPEYNMPVEKTYKTDANTSVCVVNALSSDNKSIIQQNTYVNNRLVARTEYSYDSRGNITQTKQYTDIPNSYSKYITTNYTYSSKGLNMLSQTASGVKDADGNYIGTNGNITQSYTYDTMGNMLSYTDARGNVYTYEYDYYGNVTNVTKPRGYEFYSHMYDQNAYVLFTDNTSETIHTWDSYGNYSGSYVYSYDDSDWRVATEYSYNPFGGLVSEANTHNIDGEYKKEYGYSGYNDPITLRMYGANNSVQYSEDYTYGFSTTGLGDDYYTPHRSVLTQIYDSTHTNVLGNNIKYYNIYGDLVLEDNTANPASSESSTIYRYDDNGNLIRKEYFVADDGYYGHYVTLESYTYDYAGRLTSVTDAYGKTSYITYDALGRKISESDKMGNTTYYTYDALGRVIKVDSPFNGNIRSVKKTYYDANGNVIKEQQSNNADNSAVYTFDTVEYAYDSMNNLTDVITHVTDTARNYVHYEYDTAGRMTSMHTGLSAPYSETNTGNVTEYAYDLYGNCISVTDALDNTETFTYNLNRMVTSSTDRNGVRTDYIHNAFGNTLTEKYYKNGSLVKTVSSTYDDAGRLSNISETGAVSVSYTYDSRGRIASENQGGNILEYSYDSRGNLAQNKLTVSGIYEMWTANYSYDDKNRLVGVSNSNMPTALQNTTFTYNDNGSLLTETTGDLVTAYTYNDAGLITQKSHSVNGTDPTGSFYSPSNYFTYSYYTNGNQKSMFDSVNVVSPSYEYDGAGRLTKEDRQGSGIDDVFSYTYDASGNRLTKVSEYNANEYYGTKTTETETYSYDANNRLTGFANGANTVSYTYDGNGNILTEGNKSYTYNVLNKLTAYSDGTNYATYSYYANGLRYDKSVNNGAVVKNFTWCKDNLIYEGDGNASDYLGKCYNYGYGLISSYDNNASAPTLYEKDGHGSVVMTLNSSYSNMSMPSYDAFGISSSALSSATDPMRYCGEYQDYESGLIYLRARYYNPQLGRFINEDPHWNPDNMVYGDSSQNTDVKSVPNYSA
ncbi:MAG: RHS repeat-associated core domain-containing protein, partial [Clostridia bacterium]|nr:RHS repeat-associated core domain-containing protein [Clostridia bacterium]